MYLRGVRYVLEIISINFDVLTCIFCTFLCQEGRKKYVAPFTSHRYEVLRVDSHPTIVEINANEFQESKNIEIEKIQFEYTGLRSGG